MMRETMLKVALKYRSKDRPPVPSSAPRRSGRSGRGNMVIIAVLQLVVALIQVALMVK